MMLLRTVVVSVFVAVTCVAAGCSGPGADFSPADNVASEETALAGKKPTQIFPKLDCSDPKLPFNRCGKGKKSCDDIKKQDLHTDQGKPFPGAGPVDVVLCNFNKGKPTYQPYFTTTDDPWWVTNADLIRCIASGDISAIVCGNATVPAGFGINSEMCLLDQLGCTLTLPGNSNAYWLVTCGSGSKKTSFEMAAVAVDDDGGAVAAPEAGPPVDAGTACVADPVTCDDELVVCPALVTAQ